MASDWRRSEAVDAAAGVVCGAMVGELSRSSIDPFVLQPGCCWK